MKDTTTTSEIQRAALIVSVSGSFVTPFMGSSINVALPSIAKEFGMDAVLMSWIPTAYLLTAAAFLVPLGKLVDIHGRKRVCMYGMIVFSAASLLGALSVSAYMLVLLRALQGVGAAMIFATGMAILTSVFPPQERGKALGINVAVVYLGLSVGPFIGGLVTEHFSWRGIFLVNIPIGVTSIVLIVVKLKGEWAEARGERFDFFGSVMYGAALVALMYGISVIPAPTGLWLMAAGACCAAGFVRWEMKSRSPVFDLTLFATNRVFTLSSIAALLNYSATFAVTFLLSLYLQHVKGLSPQTAGIVLITQPAMMAVLSPFAGRLSDRIEPRIVASAGMALTAVGLFLLSFLQTRTSMAYITVCLVILGFGFALFSSPNANAIMGSVDKRLYGIASGTVGTMRLLGQILSMGIATVLFAVFIGRVEITAAHHRVFLVSLRWNFFVFAGLCFAGILASLARGKLRNDDTPVSGISRDHERGGGDGSHG